MVEEYRDRNRLHCEPVSHSRQEPADRQRQAEIHQTLRRLESLQPEVGQTQREIAETKISLRNRVMLPVLGKITLLHQQVCSERQRAVQSDPGAQTHTSTTLLPRRQSCAAASLGRHGAYHFTSVYAASQLSPRQVNSENHGRLSKRSPREFLPSINDGRAMTRNDKR